MIINIKINKMGKIMISVALLGNPNVGKTTLYNGVTGLKQRVGTGQV